jgi:hypothetical protein
MKTLLIATIALSLSGCAPHCLAHRVQNGVRRALAPVPVVQVDAPVTAPAVPALTPAAPQMLVAYLAPVATARATVKANKVAHARAWTCDNVPLEAGGPGNVTRCYAIDGTPVAPSVAYMVVR